jgi:F-type H+-transporting ATPase subunit a
VVLTLVASTVLIVGAFGVRRSLALVPQGLQNGAEYFVESWLNLMTQMLGSRSHAERYFPLIATIFIFILVSNWLGLFPGVGSLLFHNEHGAIPLFRAPASDLNFTLALGLISVVMVNLIGVKTRGFFNHTKKYINLKNPIFFFVGILEIISELAKIASFSFRLFGNVFAGEVLLVSIALIVPYFIPLPFMVLEVLVGVIQAFVFSMLTLVFIAMAVSEEGH